MTLLKKFAAALILTTSLTALAQTAPKPEAKKGDGAWLFAYFKEPGSQGFYLALSRDGYHYTELNGGQPWLAPSEHGEIMRDVYLTRGPDNNFQIVWTWDWRGRSLGHASSADLMSWSAQKEIPIMAGNPDTNNVWAPETYWDATQKKWLLIWSSSFKNIPADDPNGGHHIWSSMTEDFDTFSKPAMYFNPGYVVIDATIFREGDGHGSTAKPAGPYHLIFKQQSTDPLTYQVRTATGPTLEGPWSHISGPINESWSEGPSAIQIGDTFIVFYDHYRAPARFEAVATKDWLHWTDITDKISLPPNCKHGSFLHITEEEAQRLESRHDAAPPVSAAAASAKE